MSRLTLQPSSSILRNAAPKISAILNSFTTNRRHEQQRQEERYHRQPEGVETSAAKENEGAMANSSFSNINKSTIGNEFTKGEEAKEAAATSRDEE